MDYSSYLRTLLSVWVGLGLGQLVQALHRLARFKGSVQWDWLPLVWAGLSFVLVVQTWWAYFSLLQSPLWINLFVFLLPLTVFVILYLICASALPDTTKAAEGSTVNLTTFYFSQHRYFFSLWAVLLVLAILVSALVNRRVDLAGEDAFRTGGFVAALVLTFVKRRAVHVAVTILALLALALFIVLFSLRLA